MMERIKMIRLKTALAALAAPALLTGAVALAGPAMASTHACDTALNGCRSIQSEVPNRPDLDVQGGAKVVGNPLIVYTRSATDKAEDFVVVAHPVTDTSTVTVAGTPGVTMGETLATRGFTVDASHSIVSLEFAPFGVRSGLCVSSVNPNGFATVQLRKCDTVAGTFNPWQTFQVTDFGAADGQFVRYTEPINGLVMTNPKNNGDIGTVGHRIQVKFAHTNGATGQLWGKNNS
jgi:hypothetical protein